GSEADRAEKRAWLRVRIASLQSGSGDDLDAAIATLETALEEAGPRDFVTEPLAALYERADFRKKLLVLSRQCIAAATDKSKRADWLFRSGEILRSQGKARLAVDAFTSALGEVPGRREAESALVDLYRELDEPELLARQLVRELSYTTGPEEIAMRMECAVLLADRLSRPLEALEQLRRILAIEASHAEALDRATALAETLGDHEATLEMLDAALHQRQVPAARAGLLARKASLFAHVAGRRDEAIAVFREALSLDPKRPALRAELRAVLEAENRWGEVLDCLYQEAHGVDEETRVRVLERAVKIAWERVSPDAALPWLERLRAARPEDRAVVERIANVHRIADRPELLLKTLGDELRYSLEPECQIGLHLERARIFEETLDTTALAVSELEAARALGAKDNAVLRRLDGLYARLGRHRDRSDVLEALLEVAFDGERGSLWRDVAALHAGPLKDPAAAVAPLLRAVAEAPPEPDTRRKLLADLGDVLRATGPLDAWVRCAEEELRVAQAISNPGAARRIALHRELARIYERDLYRPTAALPYLRLLVDGSGPDVDPVILDEAETDLLRILRSEGCWSELEARLAARVADHPQDGERWLELARLREKKLRSPTSAMTAYADLVEQIPDCIPGLRGLRATAARLGNWVEVARSLDLELNSGPIPPGERSTLLRELGEVWWHRLDSTEKAAEFYEAALEAEPSDLESLRALQNLAEQGAHWARALDLYEREAGVLNEDDPERLRSVWLRVAKIAGEATEEPDRALHGFSRAAELGSLSAEDCRRMAQLQCDLGQTSAFAETYAAWCDNPGAEAAVSDHIELAETLISLDRIDEALSRCSRGLEIDPQNPRAWELSALLREKTGDRHGAAKALQRAAEVLADADASMQLVRAGALIEPDDPDRAVELLRDATDRDPANLSAQSSLARVALRIGDFEGAESAAALGLELATARDSDDPELRIQLALIGGNSALAQQRFAPAVRFFSAARAIESDRPEALTGLGEALAELGDTQAASRALEPRLEQGDSYPDRARHLTIVGHSLRNAGDPEGAIDRFEAAVREDPDLAEAHEQLAGIHEELDRIDAGIAVLERWAQAIPDPAARAECWTRAAGWELRAGDRKEQAERHLREALEADPECARAAEMLASHFWETGRSDEALAALARPLESISDPAVHARLALIQARCLERSGDASGAAAAFGSAATRSAEAALSSARLFQELGQWAAAAASLRNFATHYNGDERARLPEVLEGLGRLLSGPLEDLDGAIQVYRRATSIAPERTKTRALLADLLALRPHDLSEALDHHRGLLDADPTHAASIRSVVRIALERGNEEAASNGRVIQEALGIAASGPADGRAGSLSLRLATHESLADPLSEKLRQMAQTASHELAQALEGSEHSGPEDTASSDPTLSFRSELLVAQGRLTAPALLPLNNREVGEVLSLLAALALDPDQVRGDGQLVNALASSLGRRTRRRLKRILDQTSLEAVAGVDYSAWRRELHALATARTLDGIGGDLRTALVSLICGETDQSPRDLPPGADLTALIEGCPEADALLRLTLETWLESV
ncbi:MAG: tetratricopeptide repeat protein, partial [Myxococcota bacterium]